jgi:valine--pyruvate aminotransferase
VKLSRYGFRYTGRSGIVSLMEDLGDALRHNPAMLMMGGGTPDRIPAVEQIFRAHLKAIIDDPERSHALWGRYQGPQGDLEVRQLLAGVLRAEYGWDLSAANIAVTNGGQSAFSIIANLLAGEDGEGGRRLIQFPLVPEYLGYTDTGLSEPFFTATRPALELLPDNFFKYRVDFDHLHVSSDVAALCVSRPTNPSGNVLTDAELVQLDAEARSRGIPLILDTAYGAPFPAVQFGDTQPYWSDNVILLMSLSKLGLPGLRSGFLVASEALIQAFASANTILNLASGNVGPVLATSLIRSGELLSLSRQVIRPWYQERMKLALDALQAALDDLPYRIHKPEGAFFLWLWFQDLPITSQQLYERLKQAGVLVIPGESCFPGLAEEWEHTHQCLRLSYAIEPQKLQQAARIIGRVVRDVYQRG